MKKIVLLLLSLSLAWTHPAHAAKYYAASTNGFYDSAINTMIPGDAVPVNDADYTALLTAQSHGEIIQDNGSGHPVAVDPPPLTTAQQAAVNGLAALDAGIFVTSTATSSLNGLYSVSSSATSNINAVVTYILLNGTFPGGGTTLPYAAKNGSIHTFSIPDFKNFATAIANYVAAVSIFMDSGGTIGSIPASSATIP